MPRKQPDAPCPCTWPGCRRHANCQACQAYHHPNGEKTACEKQDGK